MMASTPIALLLTCSHVTKRKIYTMKKLSRSISLLETFDINTTSVRARILSTFAERHHHRNRHCNNIHLSRNILLSSKMSSSSQTPTETPLISLDEVKRFMIDCFVAVKTPKSHAEAMANLLAEADYRGHFSHGMNRLEMYINDINTKTCDPAAVPKILKETPSTAWVDAQNGLGAVGGNFCMDLAIQKAKQCGIGLVCQKGGNHYGIASWYSKKALEQNLLGFSATNTSPLMNPTRSIGAALGTNPLSLAAPGKDGDSFILDMATTAVALGKLEIKRRKHEELPSGWAVDDQGKETTDAEKGVNGSLMPLGGSELHSGYKGYGLGLMVETLCGILAGSLFGPFIRKWTNPVGEANLGQCFIAIDPNCFAPDFEGRMSEMMDYLRNMPRAHPDKPILVPGDPERNHMCQVDQIGGVSYSSNQMLTCKKLSQELNVKPLQPC